jgi:hypothetical protein
MLFAPKTGSELRNQLGEQAGKLRTTAADGYSQATEKVSQIVDRGREAYERARTGVGGMTGGTTGGSTGSTGSTGTSSSTPGQFSGAGAGTGNYSSNRG